MMIKLAQNDHFRVNEYENILILILLEMDWFSAVDFCWYLKNITLPKYFSLIFIRTLEYLW